MARTIECVYNTTDEKIQRLADIKLKTTFNKNKNLMTAIDFVEKCLLTKTFDDAEIIMREIYDEDEKDIFEELMALL